jgi:hypothetical protein
VNYGWQQQEVKLRLEFKGNGSQHRIQRKTDNKDKRTQRNTDNKDKRIQRNTDNKDKGQQQQTANRRTGKRLAGAEIAPSTLLKEDTPTEHETVPRRHYGPSSAKTRCNQNLLRTGHKRRGTEG